MCFRIKPFTFRRSSETARLKSLFRQLTAILPDSALVMLTHSTTQRDLSTGKGQLSMILFDYIYRIQMSKFTSESINNTTKHPFFSAENCIFMV